MLSDAHATGEGYLRSPRDGSLRDIVRTTLELERSADVVVERRLGVSLASWLLAREAGDTAEWGGEWIETEPTGPQGWWPAASCDASLLQSLAALGMRWLCIGSTAGDDTARLLTAARDAGLSVALRPSRQAIDAIEAHGADDVTCESLPLLLDALIARREGRPCAHSPSDALQSLAAADDDALHDAVDWITGTDLTVVPLMTASFRQASLRAVVRAPHLADAARVLPYHDRIASLRAPGAMRMGGKEAALHLGVPILDKSGEHDITDGIDKTTQALASLLDAGHDLRIGSGAPGVGLAPGAALREEEAVFDAARSARAGVMNG
ncbi:hypothetical protein [Microbacterium sp.]|uniref:hypothetical protein n=1 Tax=Microbacterium sp. TaxID=51671 RepID=UPI002623DA3A|nr:hypothetical protein [Microbacterium sp.]